MVIARPEEPFPELSWWGWGDPSQVPRLSEGISALLAQGLGVRTPGRRPESLADVPLGPSRLPASRHDELRGVVGEENITTDRATRIRHALGKSTPDLLRVRLGEPISAPDAVILPADHDEVVEILRIASQHHLAVVPYGGGTSVVGGLGPVPDSFAGVLSLDLRRLDALLSLDEESRVAVLGAGLRGPDAESLLGARGFTIGHFPQSFEYASLGGFAAARSSGQASAGYGRFDELVVGLEAATPVGALTLGRAPKSAAGPDLRQLILGSEGALGVITSLSLQVRPIPERRLYEGWRLPSFAQGTAALRHLAQDGPTPTVLRLSDEAETALGLARPGEIGSGGGSGCLAIVGYEGTASDVERRRAGGAAVLEQHDGRLEPGAGEAWERDRYRGPYLRDALLDAGALVETLETASFWSLLPNLYRSVVDALQQTLSAGGTPPVVLCHVSHVYPSGASLYFTVGCAAAEDPLAQWHAAKAAAGDAIIAAGGSITHHHGVGRDHLLWYAQEIGTVGVRALRAVKRELDPAGILNPGALIPEATPSR